VEGTVALSDSCCEFLKTVGDAARKLADDSRYYSSPDYPIRYGDESDALHRASMSVADTPLIPEAAARLIHLAASVMNYHDSPPSCPGLPERREKMEALTRLVLTELGSDGSENGV
jgi:hypothetical protein